MSDVYYTRIGDTHFLFLENNVLRLDDIYVFKFNLTSNDIYICYASDNRIATTRIVKTEKLENIFELFEWLVPKLTFTYDEKKDNGVR